MEQKLETLIKYIKQLCGSDIDRVIEFVIGILTSTALPDERPNCPRCSGKKIIKYGNRITKTKKQRFLCKECGRTFMYTTNTIMENSRQGKSIWADFIKDTFMGISMDKTAEKYHFSHQTSFNMRHKVLMALEEWKDANPTILSEISEFDETFVLESSKGTKIPEESERKPRKHGAKAQKPGISDEYIAICTGIQRNGGTIAESVNRAKPSSAELMQIFGNHIADGTLILTDGLRSYGTFCSISGCTVKNVQSEEAGGVFNLNTVNGFHSFIKDAYNQYRGVATKYLNRYNALFALAYRMKYGFADVLFSSLANIGELSCWHSVKEIRTHRLLVI